MIVALLLQFHLATDCSSFQQFGGTFQCMVFMPNWCKCAMAWCLRWIFVNCWKTRPIRKLLAAEEAVPLTSDHLLDIFIPVYSEVGSNTRRTEEQLMKHFCTLLEEIENGQYRITLSQVLSFVTGAAAVPPTGFSPQPNIHFVDRNPCLPYSSTCSNTLFVPLHLATDYRTFADRMILVVGDCFGFGQV